ncbi:nucleotidyltransferase and HEPN domain-containing protein [Rhizobium sp. PL01]|uniref:nucleotidyltransferase and HEPN domain-containing protein n=1 Tax=Rhizobium sp. PL01 TaxID=3085631 RepID=UPI002980FDA3|nr:nucleotidyltransferase and HEPN domain-containing protein [Rhizobium sp. PL01]MDW5316854.1 nucleotidyltransferase and HEPN domain-containing protein [Rhizobium sp. PL01]
MKTSLEHLPERKQRELARVVEIIHTEFSDKLSGGTAAFKQNGRIFKIILFGSYARGTFVDEPHTMKGYRSDYDVLVIVNSKKLAEPEYWDKATDRLMWEAGIETPVSVIVHGVREVNKFLRDGQYFFSDIRREGVVLYEFDDRPLATPKLLTRQQAYGIAKRHYTARFRVVDTFAESAVFRLQKDDALGTAFMLHQAIEQAYSALLLTLTNYSPASHNLKFLRGLAEGQDLQLAEAWPRDQHRYQSWFNTLNEAYVKARYSEHYEISQEALTWLIARTSILYELVKVICEAHLVKLEKASNSAD